MDRSADPTPLSDYEASQTTIGPSRLGSRVTVVAEAAQAFRNPTEFETLRAFRYPKVELRLTTSVVDRSADPTSLPLPWGDTMVNQ